MIYLDYAANTPVNEEVLETFREVSRRYIANPNSSHRLGDLARQKLDDCTSRILQLLNTKEHELVYTSGASEANNLAIKGTARHYKQRGRHIVTTFLEHSSVNGAAAALQNDGFEVEYVNIDKDGRVDLGHLKELMRKDTVLVSVCYVDSEIGLRQDIGRIGALLKDYPDCFFHVDATQAVGKIPVSLENVDLLTFAPHKFYGINGCGVLVKRPSILLEPLIHGGISTTPFRSGTPALGLIAAAEKALALAINGMDENYRAVELLNGRLRTELKPFPKAVINSTYNSTPFILNLSIPGTKIADFIRLLEERDIYVSSKSACCAPNTVSRPVFALTRDRKRSLSTLRISLSHLTAAGEIETFLSAFSDVYNKLIK